MSSIDDYASSFIKLFAGNDSFYVENNIDAEKVRSSKGKKVKSEAYFKKNKVDETLYRMHLKGTRGLGVCPIDNDNKCTFGAIDIDHYGGDTNRIVDAVYDNNLPFFPCRSKSGGLHLYVFLKKEVQAKSLVDMLEEVIKILGLRQTFGENHIEIFPKQKKLEDGAQGNCITIPYFRADDPISYLMSSRYEPVPADDAIRYMKKGMTSIQEIEEALKGMEFADAPACIQTILTTSALGEDSGRNNFLFSCAVYAKKKHGDSFEEALEAMNKRLADPIGKGELKDIVLSVKNHEYNYKCKDVPCRGYCNPKLCSQREFGVGKEKGHFTGLEYGPLTRMLAADPYYQWQLKKMDAEDFRVLTFNSESDLLDQRTFAKLCVRYINFAPLRINDNEWYKILNQALAGVKEEKISEGTDTSDSATMRLTFEKYLTRKQAGMNKPVQIKMGFVYLDKEAGKYYFTHEGFESFLDAEKVRLKDGAILRETLISLGATSDVLKYKKASGADTEVKCWSKPVDETLKEIEEYFEDVFEEDAEIIHAAEDDEEEDDNDEGMY